MVGTYQVVYRVGNNWVYGASYDNYMLAVHHLCHYMVNPIACIVDTTTGEVLLEK